MEVEPIPSIDEVTVEKFNPDCIRKKSNYSNKPELALFDSRQGPTAYLKNPDSYSTASPKLGALLKKIESLDEMDQTKFGKKFKHFIFSDVKTSQYGPKLIATALMQKGYTLGYSKGSSGISLKSDEELKKTAYKNIYLLSSVAVYGKPISVKAKKEILARFNERPQNVDGKFSRIIIMDSGFKEGIDLFDVKYVHIFEPSTTMADQKQVIGRGTRTCGQKGLDFHPTRGWPLHVFVYDMTIPDDLKFGALDASTVFDLYMRAMNVDVRLLKFAAELERVAVFGSVDYELNKKIHNFSIANDDDTVYGGSWGGKNEPEEDGAEEDGVVKTPTNGGRWGGKNEPEQDEEEDGAEEDGEVREEVTGGDGMILFKGKEHKITFHSGPIDKRITHKSDFQKMRKYIKANFSQFAWTDVKMENACVEKKMGGGATAIDYTPTQDFVRHYFTPKADVKGMLLWHSVGTGKTCSAIAAATTNFEPAGYTILWVTRTTLKNDIWKNMFGQVCNESIRGLIKNGYDIPSASDKQMGLLSHAWRIRPMSYKQFSNLVSKKNDLYKRLVKENGAIDPLRKTLLIIDEAHKLYGGGDLSSIERPDMNALHKALMNSYEASGPASCRLLLMTATPITTNPIELVQLINLCRPFNDQLPTDFDRFQSKFLNSEGGFTKNGEKKFLDQIAGHISYLNREKDARQFAQPIIHRVDIPVISNSDLALTNDPKLIRTKYLKQDNELRQKLEEIENGLETEIKEITPARIKSEIMNKIDCGDVKPTVCKRYINSYVKEINPVIKEKLAELKRSSRSIRDEIKGLAAEKREMMAHAKSGESKRIYEQTPFGQIRDKCVKITKSSVSLDKQVNEKPEIQQIDKEILAEQEDIRLATQQYKMNMDGMKAQIAQLKKESKRDEAARLAKDLPSARKRWMAETRTVKLDARDNIRTLTARRKKTVTRLKKSIKKEYQRRKKEIKKQNAATRKARIQARKTGKILDEIQHEFFREMIGKGVDNIQSQLDDYDRLEQAKKEAKAEAKAQLAREKAEQKQRERERKAEQRTRDRQQKAEQKAREREEKAKTRKRRS